MMTGFQRCAFVSLSVLAACVVKNQQSSDPSAGEYNDYYSETGASGGGTGNVVDSGDPTAPKPQLATSTKGAPGRKGKALTSKKPPVDGGSKPRPKPPEVAQFALEGYVPTNAGAGSIVEVYGTGFKTAKDVAVMIGKKRQKIVETGDGHLVVQVAAGSTGPLSLVGVTKGTVGRPVGRTAVKSETPFVLLAKDSPFAKGRTDPNHGLVGNVYVIGKEVKELPSFDDLGAPIATIAVDNLDIASRKMGGSIKGGGKEAKEWFAIHFKGSLNVTAAGEYSLCLNANDGAQLYLDENLVVNNDGAREAVAEKCEKIAIEPGEYKLDLLYFQGTGDLGLQFTWAKDGAEKEAVPKEAFFPPEDIKTLASK